MSHSVTITRTTTTTSTSAFILNTGYLKTWPGILKTLELILGIVNVGLVSYYYSHRYYGVSHIPELFFLLMSVTFLIGTFCNLFSCVASLSTATLLSKTLYEVVYHMVACFMYLAASLTLLTAINRNKSQYNYSGNNYEPYLAASIIAMIVAIFYLFSTIFSVKTYKTI